MNERLAALIASLSEDQRAAVNWQDGALLVLAGPGAGKTRVLTARIARLLEASRDQKFKILALTFTNKAGREMRERVEVLVPDLIDRANIQTFHSFCAQILQQHGTHTGIKSDFGIYDQEPDRKALFSDALREAQCRGEPVAETDLRFLETIDRLRENLIIPEKTAGRYNDARYGEHVARVYKLYEQALSNANVLDFNGLILEASRLVFKTPAVADRIRRTHPFWLIDEFQDTSPAQYRFIRYLGGASFKNLFAVADDDQIIYQFAGASYRQIQQFRADYSPELIQLVENHRCPPDVVAIANRLVGNNSLRTKNKRPIIAMKESTAPSIELRAYADEEAERKAVAEELAALGRDTWGATAVLARNRFLLDPMLLELRAQGTKATLALRRDRFLSPHFTWLLASIDQIIRPADKQIFLVMAAAAERIVRLNIDGEIVAAEAKALGLSSAEHWAQSAKETGSPLGTRLATIIEELARSRVAWKAIIRSAIELIREVGTDAGGLQPDIAEDHSAWEACLRDLYAERGEELQLTDIVQGLALRSKEPPSKKDSVTLMSVHSAKGLEFDRVYVLGLAESILPTWQSQNAGDQSPEMEEERRNCFVAITRTKKRLVLTRAERYRGRDRAPSRFLAEMDLDAS